MHRCLIALALALTLALPGTAGLAQEPNPTESAECANALEALQAREAEARAPLAALRRQAAKACLGGSGQPLPAPRQRFAPPPIVVAPVTVAPLAPPPPPLPALALPKPAAGVPLRVMSCDAAGCWASDGSRLQRSGTFLFGSRGLCSDLGGALHCP